MPSEQWERDLSARIDAATDAQVAGEIDEADRILDAVWAELPAPKDQWTYPAQASTGNAFLMHLGAGNYARARTWLDRCWIAYGPTHPDADRQFMPYTAILKIAEGAPDAVEATQAVLDRFGFYAFKNLGREYASFAKAVAEARDPAVAEGNPEDSEAEGGRGANPVDKLCEEGSALLDAEDWRGALVKFERALTLLPEPHDERPEATWLWISIGDAQHSGEQFADAVRSLRTAIGYPDGPENGYLWLRLGQSEYELGDPDTAANSLLSSYMLLGEDAFEDEDPKYRQLLVDRGLIS